MRMTERTRTFLLNRLAAISAAVDNEPVEKVTRMIVDMIPLMVDRRAAHAYLEASFEALHAAEPERDLEIDTTSQPFSRPGPV